MSLEIAYGLVKCRSPTQFVRDYLLRGLVERSIPASVALSKAPHELLGGLGVRSREADVAKAASAEHKRRVKEMQGVLRGLKGEERYHSLSLVCEAHPSHFIGVNIARTVHTDPKIIETSGQPRPKVEMMKAFFHLDSDDYQLAAKILGEKQTPHPGKAASISYNLYLPREAIDHDDWTQKLLPPEPARQPGNIRILVAEDAFHELTEQAAKQQFLQEYLDTLSYVQGSLDRERYARHVAFAGHHYEEHAGATAYQLFHVLNNRMYGELMQRLARVDGEQRLKHLLIDRLGVSDAFAAEYAEGMWRILRSVGGREDAEFVASNTGHGSRDWRKIRDPREKKT